MRLLIVIILALVAVGSAGVWALGEYGHVFAGGALEAREPLVIEPELVAASDAAPAAPAPNPAPTLRSQPAPAAPSVQPQSVPAPATAAPSATPAPPPPPGSPVLAERFEAAPAARSAAPAAPTPVAPPVVDPAPAVAPAPEPTFSAASSPASSPAPTTTSSTPTTSSSSSSSSTTAATAAAGVTPALASQFKARKLTYNRPPAKLALNKAIDVSLVINATDDADAGKDALQGFPGTVVERDVDLSDSVSAQLTGIGFDITTQTVERQRLSGKTINRWQWRVTPTETGTRTLILEVFGYESGSLDAEPLAAYRDPIVVEVRQFDQIIGTAKTFQPVFAIVAGLAGAFSALFAFLRFREEKKKSKPAA